MAKQTKGTQGLTTRMITPEFRLSFPHLFKAQAPKPTDKPKFSVTMLYPKGTDMMGCTLATDSTPSVPISLKQVILNAKLSEWGSKENWPDDLQSPVRDGDDPKFHKDGEKPGYKGHWVIKATSNAESRPGVVDSTGTPITEPADIYPGCYCRAYVYARVWEYMGKEGVQFILDHVQKTRDGKSFGGKKPVEQVFGPIGTGSTDSEIEDDSHDFG